VYSPEYLPSPNPLVENFVKKLVESDYGRSIKPPGRDKVYRLEEPIETPCGQYACYYYPEWYEFPFA
jgi:hypothetical protein